MSESLGRGMGGRAFGALVDEGVASLQNFAVVLTSVRFLRLADLGIFSLLYFVSILIKVALRSLLLTPLSIKHPHMTRAELAEAIGGASAAAICAAIGASVAGVAVALFLSGEAATLALTMGVAVGVLLIQESWRVILYLRQRVWDAVVNDVLCLIATGVLLFGGAHLNRLNTSAAILTVWAAGTAVGAVVGPLQVGQMPRIGSAVDWLQSHWRLGMTLAGSQGAEQAATQVAFALVIAVSGATTLGQVSASRALVSPFTTLLTAVAAFAMPEAARLARASKKSVHRFLAALSAFVAIAMMVYSIVLVLLPESWGTLLAGRNWGAAMGILLPVVIWTGAAGMRIAPLIGLQVLNASREALRISVITGMAVLLVAPAAAKMFGAVGAAWALSVISLASFLMTWHRCFTPPPQKVVEENAAG